MNNIFGVTVMILGCPQCNTRFAVDAKALRPKGRYVKCGKCEHLWFAIPSGPSLAEPVRVTPLDYLERSSIKTPNLPVIAEPKVKENISISWLLVVSLFLLIIVLIWFERDSILYVWPETEIIYNWINTTFIKGKH
ncbi:MAG: zinc-ribbon domain-containing protein [Alphaproteobacteria bacterium]|nr:zinc-ribbon domain-containing protein [Alphaproteobacteria bacterium]